MAFHCAPLFVLFGPGLPHSRNSSTEYRTYKQADTDSEHYCKRDIEHTSKEVDLGSSGAAAPGNSSNRDMLDPQGRLSPTFSRRGPCHRQASLLIHTNDHSLTTGSSIGAPGDGEGGSSRILEEFGRATTWSSRSRARRPTLILPSTPIGLTTSCSLTTSCGLTGENERRVYSRRNLVRYPVDEYSGISQGSVKKIQ